MMLWELNNNEFGNIASPMGKDAIGILNHGSLSKIQSITNKLKIATQTSCRSGILRIRTRVTYISEAYIASSKQRMNHFRKSSTWNQLDVESRIQA